LGGALLLVDQPAREAEEGDQGEDLDQEQGRLGAHADLGSRERGPYPKRVKLAAERPNQY
jgi:hypothetical protein